MAPLFIDQQTDLELRSARFRFVFSWVREDAGQIRARSGQIQTIYYMCVFRMIKGSEESHTESQNGDVWVLYMLLQPLWWWGLCLWAMVYLTEEEKVLDGFMASTEVKLSLSAEKILLTEVGIPWGSSASHCCPLHPKSEMGSLQILNSSKKHEESPQTVLFQCGVRVGSPGSHVMDKQVTPDLCFSERVCKTYLFSSFKIVCVHVCDPGQSIDLELEAVLSFEPPDLSAGNWTLVFWKSNTCS